MCFGVRTPHPPGVFMFSSQIVIDAIYHLKMKILPAAIFQLLFLSLPSRSLAQIDQFPACSVRAVRFLFPSSHVVITSSFSNTFRTFRSPAITKELRSPAVVPLILPVNVAQQVGLLQSKPSFHPACSVPAHHPTCSFTTQSPKRSAHPSLPLALFMV